MPPPAPGLLDERMERGLEAIIGRMKDHEIEAWALRVIDDVKNGKLSEDSRVEVKSGWLSADRAARRIAGHCNAARGEYVLWVIGVDEKKKTVVGADENELSNWWAQVQSEFDGLSPCLTDRLVYSGDKTVCALLFDTSRRPFVVKNPAGGAVELEVPWREGTAVRSARREDLIRVLSPLEHQPEFELLNANLWADRQHVNDPKRLHYLWHLTISGYLYVKPGASFVIPFHLIEGRLEVESYPDAIGFDAAGVAPQDQSSDTMECLNQQLTVKGPGAVQVWGRARGACEHVTIADKAAAQIVLRSREIEHPIKINVTLTGKKQSLGQSRLGRWRFDACRVGSASENAARDI